jgi:putative flavoprotein involved in K+ transport
VVRSIDTLVVGGGQAGLASSHSLARRGVDHVVLEARRVGESWRSRRWDSFTLVTPNWMTALPDLPPGVGGADHPNGFLPRAEIVEMLSSWATALAAPVREGVAVTSVTRDPAGPSYTVETTDGPWRARRVIAATGTNRTPHRPRFAADLPIPIAQLDVIAYRNPELLQPGAVLVVGSGQSGCQVAEELRLAGRDVYLSVGSAGRFIRRYRGRDAFRWTVAGGLFDLTEAQWADPRGRRSPNPHLTGARGGHTINLHRFARDGVHLLGRIEGVTGSRLRIADDLHARLAGADAFAARFRQEIDAQIERSGLVAPDPDDSDDYPGDDGFRVPLVAQLDLGAAGITSVIWACGFAPDFSYLRLPVLADDGWPIHDGGITGEPGLAFVGLRFQTSAKSDLLFGVAADAARVVERLFEAAPGAAR